MPKCCSCHAPATQRAGTPTLHDTAALPTHSVAAPSVLKPHAGAEPTPPPPQRPTATPHCPSPALLSPYSGTEPDAPDTAAAAAATAARASPGGGKALMNATVSSSIAPKPV